MLGAAVTRTRRALLVLAGATALGAIAAYEAVRYHRYYGVRPYPWWNYFLVSFGYWYLWAALVPPILWFAHRFPLDRARWRRSLPLHLVAMVVVTVVQIVLWHLLILLVTWMMGMPQRFWQT